MKYVTQFLSYFKKKKLKYIKLVIFRFVDLKEKEYFIFFPIHIQYLTEHMCFSMGSLFTGSQQVLLIFCFEN